MVTQAAPGPAVRVVVADSLPLFRAGVVAALASAEDVEVVAATGLAAEVPGLVGQERPDIVLLDAWLDGLGLETCASVKQRYPGVRVLVVASTASTADLAGAVRAGADGLLARESTPEDLVQAIRTVAAGRTLVSAGMAAALLDEFASLVRRADGQDPGPARLTARELDVLRLVAQGLNNRAIAERLFISENTVKNHVRSIHEKLQVHSRTEAVVRAVREGLLAIA